MTLTLGGQTITQLAGNPDDALRVRFKVITRIIQSPTTCQVIITNLSAATAQSIMSKLTGGLSTQNATGTSVPLVLNAGYVGCAGVIFSGQCDYGINGRESQTDTTLQIFARDGGQFYDYATISKSLAAGSTPKDHYDVFAQVGAKFGVVPGYTPDNMGSPSYPRGVAFAGMAKDYMRVLASSTGNTWSVQNGQLQMVPITGVIPGTPYVLNSSSGLVGMPTQTPDGIKARCLINPSLNLGSGMTVQIDQSLIQGAVLSQAYGGAISNEVIPNIATDGLYKIIHIEVTGDTRGNDWYQDLTCIALHNATGVGNLSYIYGPRQPN